MPGRNAKCMCHSITQSMAMARMRSRPGSRAEDVSRRFKQGCYSTRMNKPEPQRTPVRLLFRKLRVAQGRLWNTKEERRIDDTCASMKTARSRREEFWMKASKGELPGISARRFVHLPR